MTSLSTSQSFVNIAFQADLQLLMQCIQKVLSCTGYEPVAVRQFQKGLRGNFFLLDHETTLCRHRMIMSPIWGPVRDMRAIVV